MRIFLLSIVLIVAACTSGGAFFESRTEFVPEIENVPICTGFVQDYEQTTFFDSPQGRIITVVLIGRDNPSYIRQFYEDTLEVLGWQVGTDGMFYRNGEQLNVTVNDAGTVIKLQLEPSK